MKNIKHKLPQYTGFELFNRNLFCFFFLIFISTTLKLSAQTVPPKSTSTGIKIFKDSINHKVNIEFIADKEINNLLVLISDGSGRTVFLDNQYHFKGNYKHSVDLKETGKGSYLLKIIKDEEQFDENLFIE